MINGLTYFRVEDDTMPVCKGFTKRKGGCQNITSCGDYCWRHKPSPASQTVKPVVDPQETAKECAICLNTINQENLHTTVCKHAFHDDCMRKWKEINREKNKKQTCPCCRRNLFDMKEAEKELLEKVDGITALLTQFADIGIRSEPWNEYSLSYLDFVRNIVVRDLAPIQRI